MNTKVFHQRIVEWCEEWIRRNTKGKGRSIPFGEIRRWRCLDCKCQPWVRGEDFYVNDALWERVMGNDIHRIICIRCFEKRLGRRLTKRDFKPWFRNNRWYGDQRRKLNQLPSARLQNRLKLRP